MRSSQFLDEFFYYSSKIILLVPFILIIFGLIIRFNQNNEKNIIRQEENLIPTPTIVLSPKIKKTTSFNLQGPLFCQLTNKDASISAYIKDKKIFAKVVKKEGQENFLVKEDCLYLWQEGQYTGEKICGIGRYLNLVVGLPFFDFSSALGNKNNDLFKELNLAQLISSCQAKNIEDKIFMLPPRVIFKNNFNK